MSNKKVMTSNEKPPKRPLVTNTSFRNEKSSSIVSKAIEDSISKDFFIIKNQYKKIGKVNAYDIDPKEID